MNTEYARGDEYDDYEEWPENAIWCDRCQGLGTAECYCGGDQCYCENNGEMECPQCDGEGFYVPTAKQIAHEAEMRRLLSEALASVDTQPKAGDRFFSGSAREWRGRRSRDARKEPAMTDPLNLSGLDPNGITDPERLAVQIGKYGANLPHTDIAADFANAATMLRMFARLSTSPDRRVRDAVSTAIRHRIRGDTSEYNTGFDAGLRAAETVALQALSNTVERTSREGIENE